MIRDIKLNVAKLCLLFSTVLVLGTGISVEAEENYDPSKYVSDYVKEKSRLNTEEENGIARIISKVNPTWSEAEKALFVHDYLCETVKYDWDTYMGYEGKNDKAYTSYGAIVLRKAVCAGYARAYEKIMNRLGIECKYVTSNILNHAWNIIKIENNWYYVDCTWDDPVNGGEDAGCCFHGDFLCSKEAFYNGGHKSTDWICEGEHIYSSTKYQTSDYYDEYFWKDVSAPLKFMNGKWFYSKNGKAYFYDRNTNQEISATSIYGESIPDLRYTLSYGNYYVLADWKYVYLIDEESGLKAKYAVESAVGDKYYLDGISEENGLIKCKTFLAVGTIEEFSNDEGKIFTIDWSSYLNDSESLPVGTLEAYIGSSVVTAGENQLILTNEYGNIKDRYILSTDISNTRYIHDISVTDGVVTYNTWLRNPEGNGTEEQRRKPISYTYSDWANMLSGTCGENLTWRFSNGTLTVSGTGAMDEYNSSSDVPWGHLNKGILEIDINEGVTSISNFVCDSSDNIEILRIPESIASISTFAIYNTVLKDIYYGGSLASWNNVTGSYNLNNFDNTTIHFAKENPAFGDVRWNVESDILTISGNGAMPLQNAIPDVPWYKSCKNVKKLVIEEGVTSICAYAIYYASNLEDIYIPKTVTQIDANAFCGISSNVRVHYDGSEKQLRKMAGNGWKWYLGKAVTDFTKVSVEFNTGEGSIIEDQIISMNASASKPVDPTRKNYIFNGWYTSSDYGQVYSFDTKLTEDTTIYAKWTEILSDREFGSVKWTISNDTLTISGNGNMDDVNSSSSLPWFNRRNQIKKIVIKEGVTSICAYITSNVTNLEEVYIPNTVTSIHNYAFSGMNQDVKIHYDGSKHQLKTLAGNGWYWYLSKADLDITKVYVEFRTGEDQAIEPQIIDRNTIPTRPTDPVLTGYELVGWYKSSDYSSFYEFNTPIDEDVYLTPAWVSDYSENDNQSEDQENENNTGNQGEEQDNTQTEEQDNTQTEEQDNTQTEEQGNTQTDNRNENENGEPDSGQQAEQQEDSNNNESGTSTSDNVDSTDQSEYSTEDNSSGSLPWTVTPKKHYDYSSDTANTTDSEENDAEDEDGIITVRGEQYEVYNSGTAATIINGDKKAKSVNIGDNLSYNGKSYEINEIASGAYKNCKNLRTVKIGANIEKIGSSAFKGCKKLKSITIKANNLRTIGAASFKGIKNGAKITIICKDKKTFNKLVKQLKKAGAKKAKFKFKKG